jgi:membrane associated rhomboid family serine protease
VSEPTPTCYRHPSRPTLVRCSNCDRPICTECMVPSSVGQRCPECAGRTGRQRIVRPRAVGMNEPRLTIALIVINVIAFAAEYRGSGRVTTSSAFVNGALYAPAVANGDWWRVITSGFLHLNVVHILFNMLSLWWIGNVLERYVGSLRFGIIYFVSLLGGSAGALLVSPNSLTVGASGAIFGLAGAVFVLERQGLQLMGPILPLLAINLIFTFANPDISKGGHVGGLAAGILAALALKQFGRGHIAYGRIGAGVLAGIGAIVALEVVLIVVAVG